MTRAVTIIAVLLGVLLLGAGIWLYNPDLPVPRWNGAGRRHPRS